MNHKSIFYALTALICLFIFSTCNNEDECPNHGECFDFSEITIQISSIENVLTGNCIVGDPNPCYVICGDSNCNLNLNGRIQVGANNCEDVLFIIPWVKNVNDSVYYKQKGTVLQSFGDWQSSISLNEEEGDQFHIAVIITDEPNKINHITSITNLPSLKNEVANFNYSPSDDIWVEIENCFDPDKVSLFEIVQIDGIDVNGGTPIDLIDCSEIETNSDHQCRIFLGGRSIGIREMQQEGCTSINLIGLLNPTGDTPTFTWYKQDVEGAVTNNGDWYITMQLGDVPDNDPRGGMFGVRVYATTVPLANVPNVIEENDMDVVFPPYKSLDLQEVIITVKE